MNTRGLRGYRRKGGQQFADLIPRNTEAREEWVSQTIKYLEGKPNFRRRSGGIEWLLPDEDITEWTYIIDLDDHAFTVNGLTHFDLDNMPPELSKYFDENDGETSNDVPEQYLTSVSRWPAPSFNAKQVRKVYYASQPTTTLLEEWGAPTWDTLSPPQHLSSFLIKTIVSDHAYELSGRDMPSFEQGNNIVCWQIVYAAAPSHLQSPPIDAPFPYRVSKTTSPRQPSSLLPFQMASSRITKEHLQHVYRLFRHCLVTICSRLDKPLYVMHEVGLMAGQIRNRKPRSGVGIIVSSWQVIAVAVDGQTVRHSPALDIHNGRKDLGDGALLLMHLLNPILIAPPLPWMPNELNLLYDRTWWSSATSPLLQLAKAHNSMAILPVDIIRMIIYYTDWHTHIFILPLVSRLVRLIALSHPRIGNHILLGHDKDNIFRVRHMNSTDSTLATFTRTAELSPPYELLDTFQHPRGVWAHELPPSKRAQRLGSLYRSLRGLRYESDSDSEPDLELDPGPDPKIGVQVVRGRWEMVEDMGTRNHSV
ncbi:hypothetical protein BDV93DRAFT_548152 [Ceratobasidium sp. AG-I]|nr:hypothetical protein BDV93DRAFT_548152 [Ceratobasidium sp. AG-I]